MVQNAGVFHILTCTCAWRRSGVRDLTSKKRSVHAVFCTFWLWHVLLATAACKFCASDLPKVVRICGVLYILTWKCTSCYSGVQFFHISTRFVHFDFKMCFSLQRRAIFFSPLNSYLRTRRFTEPTFRPSRPTNHWKNTAIRDLPNISRLWIFFLRTFAQLYLLSSDSTSLLCFSSSDSAALLCFFNCPYCQKLDF